MAVLVLVSGAGASTRGGGGTTRNDDRYTVAFKDNALPANVDQLVAAAGGRIVDRLPQIGAISVAAADRSFAAKIVKSPAVAAANLSLRTSVYSPSGTKAARSSFAGSQTQRRGDRGDRGSLGRDPQPMPDPLGQYQWDKMRMDATTNGSYKLTLGRPEVRVAFTDTGVDITHPDIAPNLDLADSRVFITADEFTPPEDIGTVQDFNGHGTWTASAVGAPINGIGISGVAPKVEIVALKTQDATGYGLLTDWADAVIYAADHGIDIVSSSIYTYAATCKGYEHSPDCNPADYIAAQKAVDYARARGVVILAALGNDNRDVSDTAKLGDFVRTQYAGLVSDPGPWIVVPAGLKGVIGVSSTGYLNTKAFVSNYGLGSVGVAAPGGDVVFQDTAGAYPEFGALLGAWTSTDLGYAGGPAPVYCAQPGPGGTCAAPYSWQWGTSMATPNAAGVAALIVSRYGTFSGGSNGSNDGSGPGGGNGDNTSGRGGSNDGGGRGTTHMRADRVEQILLGTAVPQRCPEPRTVPYLDPQPWWGLPIWPFDSATCQGGQGNNGFYGRGIVNAVAALTADGAGNQKR